MTMNTSRSDATRSVLRDALVDRAEELGIDAETVHSPSPSAITARREDGGLLRLDFTAWSAPELSR
jgi:hypothetical protein